jgi:hypothetical protein
MPNTRCGIAAAAWWLQTAADCLTGARRLPRWKNWPPCSRVPDRKTTDDAARFLCVPIYRHRHIPPESARSCCMISMRGNDPECLTGPAIRSRKKLRMSAYRSQHLSSAMDTQTFLEIPE